MTSWAEDYLSQMSKGIEKLIGRRTGYRGYRCRTVKKDIGHGLSQYNSKVQELADKAPGGLSEQAAKYPWVALSMTVIVGFLLGMFIRPARQPIVRLEYVSTSFLRRKIMNDDIFEGKWKQIRGQAKVWWGKLTDDDLDKVDGKFDQIYRSASGEVRLHPRTG